jgi:hypothetical protein
MRKVYRILIRTPEGKGVLGTDERIYIKMDLTEIGCKGVDSIQVAQERDQ